VPAVPARQAKKAGKKQPKKQQESRVDAPGFFLL